MLGGTQALSRSYFSLLIPKGREAEYFSFYHAMERGTSWFGTLVFGLVYQLTDSYRPAIFALVVFFVVGGALLLRVDTAKGIRDAGNQAPSGDVTAGVTAPTSEPPPNGNPPQVTLVEQGDGPRRGPRPLNPPDRRHDRLAEPSHGRYA